MRNSKLIELYHSMEPEELRRIDKFLRSPYFNESNIIYQLHTYIYQHLDRSVKHFTKELIFKSIYPNENFNDGRLRYFSSRLLKLLETFLLIESISQEEASDQIAVIKKMKQKGVRKNYQSKINLLKEPIQSDKISDKDYLNAYYRDELLLEFHSSNINEYNIYLAENLRSSIANLDRFYIIQKLKQLCAILNHKNILSLGFDILFKDEIIEQASQEQFKDIPHIKIYRLILQTLMHPEQTESFLQLKTILVHQQLSFEEEELREIYAYAQNYCILKINEGDQNYLSELFELYRSGLEQQILLPNGILQERNYKNITVTGLRLGKDAWVKSFINKYKTKLQEAIRENAYRYNLAKYYFYRKNHEQVLELLQSVEYNDVFYGIDSRSMLMKTYYELGEYDALYSFMSSFKIFLNRKKIVSDHHRKANQQLIKYLKKLTSIPIRETAKIAMLKKKVEATSPIADKSWLLDKISEFKVSRAFDRSIDKL